MLRKLWFRVLIVVLVVALSVGQVAATTTYRVDHMGTATMIAATMAITAAAEFAIANCAAWCATAWSAVTLAAGATAELLAMGLFYTSVVGLGAVATYMLYKGITVVAGQLMKPGDTGWSVTPEAQGVGTFGDYQGWMAVDIVRRNYTECAAAGYTGGAGGAYHKGWSTSYWTSSGRNISGVIHDCVYPTSGYEGYVYYGPGAATPATIADMNDTIKADLAGTNGMDAQTYALRAAQATIDMYADHYYEAVDAVNWDKPLPVPWPANLPLSAWQRIQQIYVNAMPQAVKDKVQAYQDTKDNVAYASNPTTANMTKTDVRDAVRDGTKEALDKVEKSLEDINAKTAAPAAPVEFTGTVPPADVGAITPPSKTNLTGVLTTFWTGLGSVGPGNILGQLSLTASGSSVFCIGLPMGLSDSCVDYGQYESTISGVGTLMKTVVTIAWVVWIFM